jgi:LPXTG-site transpeptidase (sortase) family protein
MRAILRPLGMLLIAASLAGLALLAAGPPGGDVETTLVADPTEQAAQLGDAPGQTPNLAPEQSSRANETSAGVSSEPTPTAPLLSSRVLLDERFSDNRMRWPDDAHSTASISGSGYRLVPRDPGRFVAVSAPIPVSLADVVVTATFHKVGGPPGGGYGLIVRDQHTSPGDGVAQGGRFYVLEVSDRGEIGIWRRDNDRWADLLSWTPSEAALQGTRANTLEVWAIGQRLTFFLNGVQVASQIDTALPTGGIGVFAGGDGNDVQVDRLSVRVADQMPAATLLETPTPQPTTTPIPFRPVTRVVIPSISLDAPSVPAGLIKRGGAMTWEVPAFKIGHADDTAGAGGSGNAVLVGHVTSKNVGNVFEHLHQVRVGDAVQVFNAQQRFDYRVVNVRTVSRGDVSVVEPTATPSLTLITCTGAWLPLVNDYAQRLAVRAELVE